MASGASPPISQPSPSSRNPAAGENARPTAASKAEGKVPVEAARQNGLGSALVLRWTLLALLAAAFIALLPLWPPVLLAAWGAILAHPLHQRLEKRVKGRSQAAGVITVLLVVLALTPVVVIGLSLFGAAVDLVHKLQQSGGGRNALAALASSEPTLTFDRWDARRAIELAREHGAGAFTAASTVLGATAAVGVGLFVFVTGFYTFLVRGRQFWSWAIEHSPLPRPYMHRFGNAFVETGRGLVVGVGFTALLQGLVMTIGFIIAQVPQPLVLGLLATIAALIPSIGTGLVWVPVSIGMAMTGHKAAAIATLAIGIFVSVIDNLVRPWLSRFGNLLLPSFMLLLAMLGGIAAFGAWGILIGPLFVRMAKEALSIWHESNQTVDQGATTAPTNAH
jgi:predicted PurR-regulated permease PerM